MVCGWVVGFAGKGRESYNLTFPHSSSKQTMEPKSIRLQNGCSCFPAWRFAWDVWMGRRFCCGKVEGILRHHNLTFPRMCPGVFGWVGGVVGITLGGAPWNVRL